MAYSMKEYSHGGDIYSHYEKYGVYPVDFSSSLNPLIAPIEVSNAFISSYAKSFAYPPHDYKLLRQKLAEKENISFENIILSNGASEIIYFIPYAFCNGHLPNGLRAAYNNQICHGYLLKSVIFQRQNSRSLS